MKIAQIAPPIESIPPKKYGGTERVVHALTEELVRRGHEMTLFASADSRTSAKLVSTFSEGLREAFPEQKDEWVFESHLHLGNAYAHQDEFDIIHDHTSLFGAAFAHTSRTPVVMTLHGPIEERTQKMFEMFHKPYVATISRSQARAAHTFNHAGTVYNGLTFANYPFSDTDQGYLLFVGRICPQKGLHHAIEVAQMLGLPLIIAAKYEPHLNGDYFEKMIKPKLSARIKWIGEVDEQMRNRLYAHAKAFLHPAMWSEPFGLALVEAMACGTPVVAFDKGSIPEVVWHGKTGYVVQDVQEMIQAVKSIAKIDRTRCAEYARTTFSVHKMVAGYERMYRMILAQRHHTEENLMQFLHSTRAISSCHQLHARRN